MKKKATAAILAAVILMPTAIAQAAEAVPPSPLVEAIARHESGLNPLAINVAGKSYSPATRQEAEAIIQAAQSAGKSFDVGLMQVNSWWMKRYGIPPASLLDPEINSFWGKQILAQEIARHGFNWFAVGKYHSPDEERGRQYAWRIYAAYAGQNVNAITPTRSGSNANKAAGHENLSDRRGIWRNPGQRQPGRIITFDLRQESVPGNAGSQPGAPGSPAGTP